MFCAEDFDRLLCALIVGIVMKEYAEDLAQGAILTSDLVDLIKPRQLDGRDLQPRFQIGRGHARFGM